MTERNAMVGYLTKMLKSPGWKNQMKSQIFEQPNGDYVEYVVVRTPGLVIGVIFDTPVQIT